MAWIKPALDAREAGQSVTRALEQIAASSDRAPSFSTLRAWLRANDRDGLKGLTRKRRADAGQSKVIISQRWDAATITLPDDQRHAIAAALEKRIKSLWASRANGWRQVADFARIHLIELTRAAGIELPHDQAFHICEVGRHQVDAHRRLRIVQIKRNDAKKFYTEYSPHARTDRSGLLPMAAIEGDVHHCKIYYRRDDGSIASPKLIGWADLATNRVYATIVFLEKGEGIRQEHVIRSFCDMATDPFWGVPGQLKTDNGSEYGFAELASDIISCAADAATNPIARTKPYNARAKVIESLFKVLNERFFSVINGHFGGRLTTKKTANLGQDSQPFPGTKEELRAQLMAQITRYELTAQSSASHLKGLSPRATYERYVKAQWGPTTIDRHLLETVFAVDVRAQVRRGMIRVGGSDYSTGELLVRTGESVRVRLPKVGSRDQLAVYDADGFVGFAARVGAFAYGDKAGAIAQGEQAKLLNGSIRQLRDETEAIDLASESAKLLAAHPQQLIPHSAGRIALADGRQGEADARKALPSPKEARAAKSDKLKRRLAAFRAHHQKTGTED